MGEHIQSLGEPKLRASDIKFSNGAADRVIRWLVAVAVVSLVLTAIVVGFLIWEDARDDGVWDPIGEFPEQTVVEVTDTHVIVVATKCFNESLTTSGEISWTSVEPLGVLVPVATGSRSRDLDEYDADGLPLYDDDGCITETFNNPIPHGAREHDEVSIWTITGIETPVVDGNGNNRHGAPAAWATQPFTLQP